MKDSKVRDDLLNKEDEIERSLRPKNFAEVIGRKSEKDSLSIMISSAKKRNKSLDHLLFFGPPGLGKTSFAYVVANEMNVPIYVTNGSLLSRAGDIASIMTSLEPNSIFFIDEIHRLRPQVEEVLYPAMEDNSLDILIGKGIGARSIRVDLPNITIIGATTRLGMLSLPLRDRFGMILRLDYYNKEDLINIIIQKAGMLNISVEGSAVEIIAENSRMTSRMSIKILKRCRDLAIVDGRSSIGVDHVKKILEFMGIDNNGLDSVDRSILLAMYKNYSMKPVGISSIATTVSEDKETLESVYEPYLIKSGIIVRTPKGRLLTEKGIKIASELTII